MAKSSQPAKRMGRPRKYPPTPPKPKRPKGRPKGSKNKIPARGKAQAQAAPAQASPQPRSNIVQRTYNAHATLKAFHGSQAFHRAIRGPRGSGKSTGCCIELFKKACEQAPSPDGLRHTRWAVIRNTYRELSDTTIKTWLYWFPEEYLGKFNWQSMTHHIRYKDVDMEVLFRALDRPQDIKKTLSMELTGAYINEAKEVPFGIISGLDDAIGRYPSMDAANGFRGASWHGMILDTNSPDDDHWWYKLDEQFRRGELDPKVWEFFTQPGGLVERDGRFAENPEAENQENLPQGYYLNRSVGKSKDHIRVYYCNQYGFVVEGKPVHPDYVDAVHCAPEILRPVPGRTIYIGIDFGLTPACTLGQRLVNGRWHVIDELVTERMGITSFAQELRRKLSAEYPGYSFDVGGDPAGSQEAQTDERTCFQILETNGIPARPAYHNNDPILRREALDEPLRRMIDGKPGILISPKCTVLRKALAGGYCYKRLQVVGSDRFHDKPDKNRFSHVAEASEYMLMVAGEGAQLVKGVTPQADESEWALNIQIDHGASEQSLGWMGG